MVGGAYLTATLDIRSYLEPKIQVLTHIRARVLTRKATLAPMIGVLTHMRTANLAAN